MPAMLSRCLAVATIAGLLPQALALSKQTISKHTQNVTDVANDDRHCPSIFAAVLSGADYEERRVGIREMWKKAGVRYPGGAVDYRFVMCTRGGVSKELQAEQDEHKDMFFLDCEEGYLNGILTRKVAAAMKAYLKNTGDKEQLFMKIDDDTYISFDKLCDFMVEKQNQEGAAIYATESYMGVFAEGNENMDTKHAVIRDPKNPWFEPFSKYKDEFYPTAAKGGPGYILPRWAVQEIVDKQIDTKMELNNEDKAVGYWVTAIDDNKEKINYVNIPGTDGYEEHEEWIVTTGSYKDYPHILHHHLSENAIACMHKVEFSSDPNMKIDHCFEEESLFSIRESARPRIHMP